MAVLMAAFPSCGGDGHIVDIGAKETLDAQSAKLAVPYIPVVLVIWRVNGVSLTTWTLDAGTYRLPLHELLGNYLCVAEGMLFGVGEVSSAPYWYQNRRSLAISSWMIWTGEISYMRWLLGEGGLGAVRSPTVTANPNFAWHRSARVESGLSRTRRGWTWRCMEMNRPDSYPNVPGFRPSLPCMTVQPYKSINSLSKFSSSQYCQWVSPFILASDMRTVLLVKERPDNLRSECPFNLS